MIFSRSDNLREATLIPVRGSISPSSRNSFLAAGALTVFAGFFGSSLAKYESGTLLDDTLEA